MKWLQKVTKWSDFSEMPKNQDIYLFCVCMLAKNSLLFLQSYVNFGGEKKSIIGIIFLEQPVCTVSGFAVIHIAHTNVIAFLLVPDV